MTESGGELIVKILIATDIHVGYAEKDKIRYADSYNTLEEVLDIAVKQHVDMILLGGDLFHENHPSRDIQIKVTRLFRKYCLSDRPVQLQFISDPSINFKHSIFPHVNYEDANINVGMPVFTIHGNHDDLAGKGLTALDLLHECGLLNLIGKFNEIEQYDVTPVLLKKGNMHIAIYGISSQRDDRLCRAFKEERIKFLRPKDDADIWFNILVLHQNRPRRSTMRSTGSYIPDTFIPSFFDLVIWGHEHESLIEPVFITSASGGGGFYLIQPGSTIATSLSREESGQKHVCIVTIRGVKEFKSNAIALQTVRPYIFDEMRLDADTASRPDKMRRIGDKKGSIRINDGPAEKLITNRICEMIAEANEQRRPTQPLLPLIRLRVEYADDWADVPYPNIRQFATRFAKEVANPNDMLIFKRSTKRGATRETHAEAMGRQKRELKTSVEDIVKDYFLHSDDSEKMLVLSENTLGRAVSDYVSREVNDIFPNVVKEQLTNIGNELKSGKLNFPDPIKMITDQNCDKTSNMEQFESSRYDDELLERLSAIRSARLEKRTTTMSSSNAHRNHEQMID